jgi:adenosylhomocysteine nucleosidase
MKHIVLVFAMAQERDASLSLLATLAQPVTLESTLHKVVFSTKTIWLLHAGVTMLNAYKLALFLNHHHVDEVINVGTCAGLRNLRIGDVIHSRCFYHHDIDLSFFPQSLGYLKEDPTTYHQHPVLVSGNTFLASKAETERVIETFDADAFDMESFGFYAICKAKNIPFSAIRGVTDDGQDHAENSFESNLLLASKEAARTMLNYVGP